MIEGFAPYRRWRPTPLFLISALFTLSLPLLLVLVPQAWPWWLGAALIDHLVMTVAGLLPRCNWLGSNWTRLPAAAAQRGEIGITFDDGPDAVVTPQVLEILDRYDAKATFFCIGDKLLQHPELARQIVARGHSVANHSMHHGYWLPFCLPGGWLTELEAAQQAIAETTGRRSVFFRPPVGLRNPFLDPVLSRLGLQLTSWSRRGFDTLETGPERVLNRLCRGLRAGDILLLHDANSAVSQTGLPVVLEVLPSLLEAAAALGLRAVTLEQARDGA